MGYKAEINLFGQWFLMSPKYFKSERNAKQFSDRFLRQIKIPRHVKINTRVHSTGKHKNYEMFGLQMLVVSIYFSAAYILGVIGLCII